MQQAPSSKGYRYCLAKISDACRKLLILFLSLPFFESDDLTPHPLFRVAYFQAYPKASHAYRKIRSQAARN